MADWLPSFALEPKHKPFPCHGCDTRDVKLSFLVELRASLGFNSVPGTFFSEVECSSGCHHQQT